jgi:hypothetical protein
MVRIDLCIEPCFRCKPKDVERPVIHGGISLARGAVTLERGSVTSSPLPQTLLGEWSLNKLWTCPPN